MPTYPNLEIRIAIDTWDMVAEVCPDAGFEGGPAIPQHLRREILAEPSLEPVQTADNTVQHVPAWPGIIEIAGREVRGQAIGLGGRFLQGREVLDQFEVCFPVLAAKSSSTPDERPFRLDPPLPAPPCPSPHSN